MTIIKRLEKKYGIKVADDSFFILLQENIIRDIKCIQQTVVLGKTD